MNFKQYRIEEIAKVVGGGTPSSDVDKYWNGHIPWITPNDLSNHRNKYIERGERNITEIGLRESSAKLLPVNTVLLTSRAPIGYLAIAKNPVSTNQGFQSLICDTNIVNPEFLFYLLKLHKTGLEGYASGATFPEISKKELKKYKLDLPSIIIQNKIINVLSTFDILIENNLTQIRLLEEIAKITYEDWFVRKSISKKDWRIIPIGKLIKFQKGKKSNQIIFEYKKGFKKLLLLGGIESGDYCYTNPKNQVISNKGDLIMLMDGARSSKVFFADDGVIGSTMAKIIIQDKDISPTLLKHYFEGYFEWMQTNNTGAAIPHANKSFINKMPFKMPPKEILKKWKDNMEPIYSLIYNLKEQNQLLKEARDIILPRLMTGIIKI